MSNEHLLSQGALYLTFYKQKLGRNAMFRHFVQSVDKSYQWDFPKVVVLKRSTKAAISNLFHWVPCVNL